MPPGLNQPQLGGMPLQRPGMQMPGMQPRNLPVPHLRLGGGGMQMNQMMNRPQNSLMPNPNGQGLLRGPPPGHRLQGPGDTRGPQPRPDWDRQGINQFLFLFYKLYKIFFDRTSIRISAAKSIKPKIRSTRIRSAKYTTWWTRPTTYEPSFFSTTWTRSTKWHATCK
jgi:hypothetical protein